MKALEHKWESWGVRFRFLDMTNKVLDDEKRKPRDNTYMKFGVIWRSLRARISSLNEEETIQEKTLNEAETDKFSDIVDSDQE